MQKDENRKSDTLADDLINLDFAKQAAQNAKGEKENVYGVWGPIWKLLRWYDAKKTRHTFKKKTYLILLVCFGWIGGHRYYQGRWMLGLLYTALFWTGIPFLVCVTDFMEAFPIKADENDRITL